MNRLVWAWMIEAIVIVYAVWASFMIPDEWPWWRRLLMRSAVTITPVVAVAAALGWLGISLVRVSAS